MDQNTVLSWAGAIVLVGGAVGVLWKVLSPVAKKTKALLNSLDHFTRDWFGEEATPGRDKVPGVMERLNNIDGELKHNGGSTMKDAVRRIENSLTKITQQVETMNARLEQGDKRFDDVEEELEVLKRKAKA